MIPLVPKGGRPFPAPFAEKHLFLSYAPPAQGARGALKPIINPTSRRSGPFDLSAGQGPNRGLTAPVRTFADISLRTRRSRPIPPQDVWSPPPEGGPRASRRSCHRHVLRDRAPEGPRFRDPPPFRPDPVGLAGKGSRPMTDRFEQHTPGLESPASHLVPVTPDDTTDLAMISRALNVAQSGFVQVTTSGGSVASVYIAAGTAFPVCSAAERDRAADRQRRMGTAGRSKHRRLSTEQCVLRRCADGCHAQRSQYHQSSNHLKEQTGFFDLRIVGDVPHRCGELHTHWHRC
jgi:hypothetical protein